MAMNFTQDNKRPQLFNLVGKVEVKIETFPAIIDKVKLLVKIMEECYKEGLCCQLNLDNLSDEDSDIDNEAALSDVATTDSPPMFDNDTDYEGDTQPWDEH